MAYLVVAITVTFFVAFVLLFLLLGGRSPESARLIEVTSGTPSARTAVGREPRTSVIDADRIARLLGPVRGLLGSSEDTELSRRLGSAGYRKPSHVDIFYAAKMALPILGAVTTFLLVKQNVFFWVVVAAAVGFLLPDLWLMRALGNRQDRIRLSLPDALDLLVICMEAGLGLDQALVRVGDELKISHPDLSDEFLLLSLEQRAGKPRVEAWRHLADRTAVDSVRQFVHMLVQTERFGTPISKSLGAFADALRVRRRQQAEEMAAKTTIKMIPPLVFCIFPSLFIVLLGPAIIAIVRNLAKVIQ